MRIPSSLVSLAVSCAIAAALVATAPAWADTKGAADEVPSGPFVPLPDCSSLPKGQVAYSAEGQREQAKSGANALTDQETQQQWQLLFDGKNLHGWKGFQRKTIPGTWHVADGFMSVTKYHEGDPLTERGDVRTAVEFENFELRLQWAATPASNSGIFFLAREGVAESIFEGAPEVQILDDARHEDGALPSHRAGGLYDLYAPRCNALRPVGQYNDVRLVVNQGHVEHWLNGYRVLEYDLGTPQWRQQVAKSKFKDMPQFGAARRGFIALQDHGDVIRFRNIRVRSLSQR